MEVPWRGINASNKANRTNTTAISHSKWNNNHADTKEMKHKWTDIQKTGVKTIKTKDQNGTAFNVAEKNWSWLKAKGGKYAWLFSRNFKSSFDASDAGMTWYIITGRGDQNAGMTRIKEVFNGVVVKPKDCAGVPGGTAYIDDCGECVGGTTGKEPCVVPVKDCAGVPGGTAYIDDCGECVGGTTGKEPCVVGNCTDVTLAAIKDFPNFNVQGFVPGYIDNKRQALAVNAKQHKDKWAAAIATFNGESATYNITMTSLLETDGECSYKLKVNGTLVGEYQNIPTKKDYTPYTQTFEGVQVSKGAKIQVEFNTHSNKTVPEGNGWAYARGRWTKVEFVCAGTIDCSANVDPIVTLSAPATVKEGFPIALTASVTDENMGIVEFYRGTTKVGTATSAPYTVNVTAGAPGVESFYAKAIDKCDGEGMSATVDVTVTKGGGQNCDIYTEIAGLVVMEAENTKSPLGKWKKVSSLNGYSGTGHIEFTGNKPSGGSANSPLTYKFKITESGDYRMLLRAHKRLAGSASDHCNDAYVKVTGDYTSGAGGAPINLLKSNTKFFGGSATGWGWAQKLDANHKKHLAIYKFKAGETYTMTISGRSQRFNIDRILFFKTSIPIATAQAADKETKDCRKSQFGVESLANTFEVYPNPASHTINFDVNGTTDVKVFNMQGKVVYSKVLNSSTTISSSELGGSGLYFIKANNESYKLIVE
ncbi:MAG: T9SS type A sorting domain-containing protein, partial [Bacteroidales bacterium]|nr:T9SS type A sorting domain-containing protein [Bacteroidales bacterium]